MAEKQEYRPSPEEIQEPDRSYQEKTKVNGIEIGTYWDAGYRGYVIFFPQIRIGEESDKRKVDDQLIIIDSQDKNFAKVIFDLATKEAGNSKDAYELWHKVKESI